MADRRLHDSGCTEGVRARDEGGCQGTFAVEEAQPLRSIAFAMGLQERLGTASEASSY